MGKHFRFGFLLVAVFGALIAALAFCVPLVGASHAAPAAYGDSVDRRAFPPEGVDLDVTFINRSPLYDAYCVDYPWDIPGQPGIPFLCPGTEDDQRWPEQGEIVTFTGHIVNKGTVASPAFDYAWQIDGAVVASGTLPALAPAAEVTATYQWPWAHTMSPDGQRAMDDHTVGLMADPANAVGETYETNNSLTDPTNAMSFRIYITPEMYDAYNIPVDPQWPWSAEDWLQKQIATMNWDFTNSTYPVAPQGATVRVRINTIGVSPTNPPGDGEHDGGWFVDADYRHGASGWYDPTTDIDWALIHELSHQVSIIDLYMIGAAPSNLFVTDRLGNPVNFSCDWWNGDLMGGGDIWPHTDHNLYSSHTAGGASTYAGYRNGYYGSYLFDIPLDNYFRVLDSQGNPAPGVQVALYRRTGPWDWSGGMGIDGTAEITGTTDGDGLFLLTNRSVHGGTITRNGHVLHDNPFGVVDIIGSQNLFLVQLKQGDHEEFRWLDITEFNLVYWQGDTISHTFTISSHVPPPGAPAAPTITDLRVEGDRARLCWQPSSSPGVAGYRLYRATAPRYQYTPLGDQAGLCVDDIFDASTYGGRVFAVTAVDDQGRESGFSNFRWAPSLTNPSSVVIAGQGERIILDPRNGYALSRQGADRNYRQYVGSVHYHLENSQFMALDVNERLLFNHPGDAYVSRHSVRVATLDATPVLEFGQQGSGPGEFQTPTGVAAWGEPCTFGGPYEPDEHTLLLLHVDGSYTGAQGEVGSAAGTEFAAGRYGQGVVVDDADALTYATAGNLNRTQGAIEFWLRPNWDGDDEQNYVFFEVGNGWLNRMRIMKDGANNLRFMLWDSVAEYGVAHNVADWQAGEWHHVAVTWQDTDIALFIDGQLVESSGEAHVPDGLDEPIYVGSASWEGWRANAVIDELRISDLPRVGNSDQCNHILVADSGNHRIQAFDSLGHYIAEFGSPGSGPGQFNDPQGLAVDGSDRVIVVDRGNDRLQVLSYDGQTFGYLDSLTGGFNAPTGVAADASGNLAVADTGNNRIVVLDAEGSFVAEYTAPNDGYTGVFNAPRGVAVEADGDLVVADTGNRRVVTILRAQYRLYLPLVSNDYSPAGTGCQELIQNGGFEDDAAWVIGATPRPARYTTEQAHSGDRSILLGLKPGESDVHSYSSVRQAITVPEAIDSATLTFWYHPLSDLDTGDFQECLLLDQDGGTLAILLRTNVNTAAWTSLSYDLSAYAGQTVQVYLNAYNDGDGSGVAGFYLDDVSVESCPTPGLSLPSP